jgi:predicted enzyme related to lactoylglutathione lyase
MLQFRNGVLGFITIVLVACSSVSLNMPAVTESPTDTRLAGKIIWHELLTDTPVESRRFYHELFGWEFEELGLSVGFSQNANYTLIRNKGKLIGGMIDQNLLPTDADISQWVVLMSVADIDAATRHVEASNGKVFSPPVDLADRGRMAVVTDPQGAFLSLLETRGGDPLDSTETDIGGFLWNELWTSDVEAASRFYQGLANFKAEDRAVKQDAVNTSYRLMKVDGVPRVGVLPNPVPDLMPVWTTYIRVTDAAELDAIVARVEDLGGSLLLAPQDRAIGGRVALIADPSGAGVAIQTWPDKNIEGE